MYFRFYSPLKMTLTRFSPFFAVFPAQSWVRLGEIGSFFCTIVWPKPPRIVD